MRFPFKDLAEKWLPIFDSYQQTPFDFKVKDPLKKKYILSMFPYPSADGLHVGHVLSYTGADILARFYRSNGYQVFLPIGFDSFGLPTENFAIKKGVHPHEITQNSIKNFTSQLKSLALDYNWSESVETSSPEYYAWTQWMFSYMYKRGLAYRKTAKANWCPECKTVLANEQVINGRCERHPDTEVIQANLPQWFFKTTKYTQELIDGIQDLNWPDKIKLMQKNWIGASEGTVVRWKIVK
jgi:leucyl-tRNA synthetase